MRERLPNWLLESFRVALSGEIYPQIRLIAVRYKADKSVLIRYYLDREPTEFDLESIEVVAVELDATTPEGLISKLDVECVCANKGFKKDLDHLTESIYSRREYEIHENPDQSPNYSFLYVD